MIAELMLDVADIYGWPPDVIKDLTITELIFWRNRNGRETASRMRF